jgi:hypothetical protein
VPTRDLEKWMTANSKPRGAGARLTASSSATLKSSAGQGRPYRAGVFFRASRLEGEGVVLPSFRPRHFGRIMTSRPQWTLGLRRIEHGEP